MGEKSELRSTGFGHTRFPRQADSCLYGTKNLNFEVVYRKGI